MKVIIFEFNIKTEANLFPLFDQILSEIMFGISRKSELCPKNYDFSYWFNTNEYDIRLYFFYLFKLTNKRKSLVKLSMDKFTSIQMEILKEVSKDIDISMEGDNIILRLDNKYTDIKNIIRNEYISVIHKTKK